MKNPGYILQTTTEPITQVIAYHKDQREEFKGKLLITYSDGRKVLKDIKLLKHIGFID